MFFTSLAAVAMGLVTDRFRLELRQLHDAWLKCRRLSRDLLIASQVSWFGTQGLILIGTWVVGTAQIGGLRATYTVSGPIYLILSSLDNIIPMRLALELKTKGTAGAHAFIQKAIRFGVPAFALFLFPLAICGKPILRLVYGPQVAAFYLPMLMQLVTMVMQIPSRLWGFFYRGIQDSHAQVIANSLSALTGIIAVYWFGHLWHAMGIAFAGLCAQVVVVLYCMFHWQRNKEGLLSRYRPITNDQTEVQTLL